MKSNYVYLMIIILGFSLLQSCAKCYTCKDKSGDSFIRVKVCDKDFDKGDIDAIIEDYEDDGYTCHASSKAM